MPENLGSKMSGLFKRSPAGLDFPVSEVYEGPYNETSRRREIDGEPLTHHITAIPRTYHYGTLGEDDEERFAVEEPKEHGKSITEKFGSLFKKKDDYDEFPRSDPYEGPYSDSYYSEAATYPLSSHVTVYHPTGRSDGHQTIEARKSEFPINELPYVGAIDDTRRRREIENVPIDQTTSIYHSGFYETLPSEGTDKSKSFATKLGELFKRDPAKLDYPVSEQYLGELNDTRRAEEVDGHPLTHCVSVYHSGRSDEGQPKPQDAEEQSHEHGVPITEKIKGLFKRSDAHDDYPRSDPFTGQYYESHYSEASSHPLSHHVTAYHNGRSDEPTTLTVDYEFPTAEPPYTGPMTDTYRRSEAEGVPLTHSVAVYNVGHYDQIVKPAPEEPEKKDIVDTAKALGEFLTSFIERTIQI